VALKVLDKAELSIPNIGMALFKDLESGEAKWVNTSSAKVRKRYEEEAKKRDEELRKIFRRSKTDFAEIFTDEGYIKPLMNLFKNRV
jgi:uncharacterized protein (DUF58 family)